MVEALQNVSVPLVTPANQCTPVRSGAQKTPQLAFATAHEEKGPACHVAAPIVAWILYLGLMAQIEPAFVKHTLLLHLKNLRRCHSRTMDSEDARFRVVYDKAFKLHHVGPPFPVLDRSLVCPKTAVKLSVMVQCNVEFPAAFVSAPEVGLFVIRGKTPLLQPIFFAMFVMTWSGPSL